MYSMDQYIEMIRDFISSNSYMPYLAGTALLCLILLIVLLVKGRNQNKLKSKLDIVDRIDSITSEMNYEKKLHNILELISHYANGEGYFLYLYDDANNRYRLEKAFFANEGRLKGSGSKVEVGYGRIIAYEKEVYSPPIAFDNAQIPEETSVVMDGRFTVLILPVMKSIGFISISGKAVRKAAGNKDIQYVLQKLQPVLAEAAGSKAKKESVLRNDIIVKDDPKAGRIIETALLAVGADSGFFISIENNYCELKAISGFAGPLEEKLRNNIDQLISVEKLVPVDGHKSIDIDDDAFSGIPDLLKGGKVIKYLIVRTEEGSFTACYEKIPEKGFFVEYRIDFIKLLISRIRALSSEIQNERVNESQYDALCELARKIDDEEPYSVGYSDLLSRYAEIVARETGLNQHERINIRKAALLSNVGVITVPESILKKNGLYDENEYEVVKRHAEYGAQIAELFTGNSVVADFIRYHHERIDGLGYPSGKKGEEIPFGARIIGAVQSFLSKIKGRNYRDPLPFEKIIAFINEESGKSLDKAVVDSLTNWFRKKQEKQILTGRPLGSCWEMRCSSEDICQKCPAYLRKDKFCWEFPENNCRAHGNNSCETCYVYTEYMLRNAEKPEGES